jgi:ribonuclease HII
MSPVLIGVDENGLGPRLGPLIVTAVVAHAVTEGGAARAQGRPRGAMRARLGDSKRLVAWKDTSLGEAWARAIARRMGHGEPSTPDELVRWLCLDAPEVLRAPCPGGHERQCWSAESESLTAEPKLVAKVEKDLARLEVQGVDVRRATVAIACTRRINDAIAQGFTRFHVDLHQMERLVLDARARADADVVALCGKVGGFDRYVPAFGPMNGRLHAVVGEGRARSEYSFPGVGRLAFVRDADEKHLLVCMASLVGKWVRDLLMARIVRYHRETNADLPDASGYHDPVTTRFVEATRLSRKRRALPDECFERRAWADVNDAT